MPAISGETKVRTDAKTLCAAIAFIISATIWGYAVYSDVQRLKASDAENTKSLGLLRDDVAHIRWLLEPEHSSTVVTNRKP